MKTRFAILLCGLFVFVISALGISDALYTEQSDMGGTATLRDIVRFSTYMAMSACMMILAIAGILIGVLFNRSGNHRDKRED